MQICGWQIELRAGRGDGGSSKSCRRSAVAEEASEEEDISRL